VKRMSSVIKVFKLVLLGVVGYALGSLENEMEWILTQVGITFSILFLILIGVGLIWVELAGVGLGITIHLVNGLYIFAFLCVIGLMFLRDYENGKKK
jgi:hypothetical protein